MPPISWTAADPGADFPAPSLKPQYYSLILRNLSYSHHIESDSPKDYSFPLSDHYFNHHFFS